MYKERDYATNFAADGAGEWKDSGVSAYPVSQGYEIHPSPNGPILNGLFTSSDTEALVMVIVLSALSPKGHRRTTLKMLL